MRRARAGVRAARAACIAACVWLLTPAVHAQVGGLEAAPPSAAADSKAAPNEQVIVPEVERRTVRVPSIPSNDFEIGVFGGTYSTQNFGSSAVQGLRLGYHVSEDLFVEAAYARTKVSDEVYRRFLPGGGVFANPRETLTYYNVSLGWNVLPGEVFFGRRYARPSAGYLIAGVGSTRFFDQRGQTINFGFGLRLFMADWVALQIDMRDHLYSLDLLGERENTQNLELAAGLTFFF